MWTTRKELEAVLAQAGLGEWSPRLAAAARHAMILEPGPVKEGADAPIGASRLGGTPDLPAGIPWPWRPALPDRTVFKDHAARPWPLSFVAQIDFAEILSAGGLEGFPSSGRLLFFCDPIETWGTTGASVMFITEQTDRLGRRDFPVEFANPGGSCRPRDFMFIPRRVAPKLWLLPPAFGSRELLALHGAPPPPDTKPVAPWPPQMRWGQEHEPYHQFWRDLAEEHPNAFTWHGAIHQLGGIAFPWQDPLETDCVKYADDDYWNHPTLKAFHERIKKDGPPFKWPDYEEARQAFSAFEARERATHFARADGWQHVLQIETDSEVGPWIGEGCLYVCIRKSDLAERRFDRCWTMPQCT
jgi:uncharacterized protein YwqG